MCITHAAFWAGQFRPDLQGAAYARLATAVPVFFALSGFLLVRPWVRAARQGGESPDLRRYFTHRAWRILPAYWTVVIVVYLIYLWRPDSSPHGHTWAGFLRNMLFTHIYGVGYAHTGLTQMWSMCVEVAFYLVLPALGWLLLRLPGRLWVVPAGMIVVAAGWQWLTTGTHLLSPTATSWPPAHAAAFGAGILVALTMIDAHPSARRRWLLILYAAAAFAVLLTPAAGPLDLTVPTPAQAILRMTMEAVIGGCLVAAFADGGPAPLLGCRPLVWLGSISYEYFLVHMIVMDFVVLNLFGWPLFTGSTWAIVAATTLFSIPLAWLLHAGSQWLAASATGRRRPDRSALGGGRQAPPTAGP